MFDDWYETHEGRAEEPRELKVRLPLWLHMKMHGLKLVYDQTLSETTERALRFWLQAVERGDVAPDDPCAGTDGDAGAGGQAPRRDAEDEAGDA